MLSEIAASLVDRCTFAPNNGQIACAVSGGADSLALLALAIFTGHEAVAYHVDHGIRPGSSSEADIVQEAANKLGAKFESLKVSCPPGPNLEARAREARFAVLPEGVATGHTADDQAETVLLNMLRGSGLDGLAAMKPGPRHPILALRREETVALTASLNLTVVNDPSNNDPAFRRNRVRHEVLPLLCDVANRDVVPILSRQAGIFASEAAVLDELVANIDPANARAIAGAPLAVARRAIRAWVREQSKNHYSIDAQAVDRILAVAVGDVVACEITGGDRVRRSQGRLHYESFER